MESRNTLPQNKCHFGGKEMNDVQITFSNPNNATNKEELTFLEATDLIAPAGIQVLINEPDVIRLGGKYLRVLMMIAYPSVVELGWFKNFFRLKKNVIISLHITPTSKYQAVQQLRKQQAFAGSSIESAKKRKAMEDTEDVLIYLDAKVLREKLARGNSKLYSLGFYIGIEAESLEELAKDTKFIEAELASLGIISKRAIFRAKEGLKSVVPTGQDLLKVTHTFTTEALASLNPFITADNPTRDGVLIGLDSFTESLVMINPFKLQNANINVLAMSGSGKTFFIKLYLAREHALFNTKVIVIDPEDEYGAISKYFNGEVISLDFDSNIKINPFNIDFTRNRSTGVLRQKIDWLMGLYPLMLGSLSAIEKSNLEKATEKAYIAKGLNHDCVELEGVDMPTLEDVYNLLYESKDTRALADGLWRWVHGSSNLFNCQSQINLKSDFTCFTIKNLMTEELKTVAAYVITGVCWDVLRKKHKKLTRIVIDEAHLLMKYSETAEMMDRFARQCRKYGAGQITISQSLEEYLNSPQGEAVATNASIQVFLRQHDSALKKIKEHYKLGEVETQYLKRVYRGEGLILIKENHREQRIPIRVLASKKEQKLYSIGSLVEYGEK